MRLLIDQRLTSAFPEGVREHQVELRLLPIDDESQRVLSVETHSDPESQIREYIDAFGNTVHHFGVAGTHDHLDFSMTVEMECSGKDPLDYPAIAPEREADWIGHSLKQVPRLWDYVVHRSPVAPDLDTLAFEGGWPDHSADRSVMESAQRAMHWVRDNFELSEETDTRPAELTKVLRKRRGTEADLSHLLIALVRSWGYPARYVRGLIAPGDCESDQRIRSPGHAAWMELLIPGAGWRGLDAARLALTDSGHIRVAYSRDANDLSVYRNSFQGGGNGPLPDLSIDLVCRHTSL